MSEQISKAFNPSEHLMQLKSRDGSKDYLPVQWRLVWFREAFPHGTIETEMVHFDPELMTEEEAFVWNAEKRKSEKVLKQAKGIAIFRATVKDGMGGVATGTKSEKAASFGDYIEKAETGAIGRALAALGYGTQFAPDLDEAHRIADAPVERSSATSNGHASNSTPAAAPDENAEASITEQQLASIRKLCQHLSKQEPDNVTGMSFLAAKKLLQQLTAEYKELREAQQTMRTPATDDQKTTIRALCQKYQRGVPAEIETLSTHAADVMIRQMNGEFREQAQPDCVPDQRGQQQKRTPSGPLQNPALIAMISKAKDEAKRLGLDWEEEKTLVLKKTIPDAQLSPQQVGLINQDMAKAATV